MKRTIRIVVGLAFLMMSFLNAPVVDAEEPAQSLAPSISQRIIINPTPSFNVDVWTDRGDGAAYYIGEPINIHFRVNRDAFVTVYNVNANGDVSVLFPNRYQPNNFVGQNITYSLPGTGNYQLIVAPPPGTEYIQVVATTSPGILDLRAEFTDERPKVEPFNLRLKSLLVQVQPREWASAYTYYQIADRQYPPLPQTSNYITSQWGDVSLYLDGSYLGETPYRLSEVAPGRHQIVALRPGYRAWIKDFTVRLGQRINTTWVVKLEPLK